jgi:hypothetical protein
LSGISYPSATSACRTKTSQAVGEYSAPRLRKRPHIAPHNVGVIVRA